MTHSTIVCHSVCEADLSLRGMNNNNRHYKNKIKKNQLRIVMERMFPTGGFGQLNHEEEGLFIFQGFIIPSM